MDWLIFNGYFDGILQSEHPDAPYSDEAYFNYAKLNSSRMNRWLKRGEILPGVKAAVEKISKPQTWIVITEPWCGDAAHTLPFMYMLSQLSMHIKFEIQLRDDRSEIDQYLTNGGKAIPMLIIRDEDGKDLGVWGPRPKAAQKMYLDMKEKNVPLDEQKEQLQHWYNEDKGVTIQKELEALLTKIV
jgi:hypothetical protein